MNRIVACIQRCMIWPIVQEQLWLHQTQLNRRIMINKNLKDRSPSLWNSNPCVAPVLKPDEVLITSLDEYEGIFPEDISRRA